MTHASMTWDEVVSVHRTIRGVNIQEGNVVSLLAGSGTHEDAIDSSRIFYTIPHRDTYKEDRECMDSALELGNKIRVFRKIATNSWHDLGLFCITKKEADETGIMYTLTQG